MALVYSLIGEKGDVAAEFLRDDVEQVSNVAELAHRILAKIPENSVPPDKRSYAFGRHIFHYIVYEEGTVVLCLAEEELSRTEAFCFLEDVYHSWMNTGYDARCDFSELLELKMKRQKVDEGKPTRLEGLNMARSAGIFPSGVSVSEDDTDPTFTQVELNDFRSQLLHGVVPNFDDVSYKNVFEEYSFMLHGKNAASSPSSDVLLDIPEDKEDNAEQPLQEPTIWHKVAVTKSPFTLQMETYLAVAIDASVSKARMLTPFSLVIALDVSISMSRWFKSCRSAIKSLIQRLTLGDEFALVTFSNAAEVKISVTKIRENNVTDLLSKVDESIQQREGGCNMYAGMKVAADCLRKHVVAKLKNGTNDSMDPMLEALQKQHVERRVILLTRHHPHEREKSPGGVFGLAESLATTALSKSRQKTKDLSFFDGEVSFSSIAALIPVMSTFISVGFCYSQSLVTYLQDIPGCAYYAIQNDQDLQIRFDEGFQSVVAPIAADIEVRLSSPSYQVDKIYNSIRASEIESRILRQRTIFPRVTDADYKGCLALVALHSKRSWQKTSLDRKQEDESAEHVTLTLKYRGNGGQAHEISKRIEIPQCSDNDYYEDVTIRKAVLLKRYVDVIKNWMKFFPTSGEANYDYTEIVRAFSEHFSRQAETISASDTAPKTAAKLQTEQSVLQTIIDFEQRTSADVSTRSDQAYEFESFAHDRPSPLRRSSFSLAEEPNEDSLCGSCVLL